MIRAQITEGFGLQATTQDVIRTRDRPRDQARQDHSFTRQPKLPPRSWDSHMHVFGPHSLDSPTAPYHPIPSSLSQALAFESILGISNIVLVQPSCYGNDNSYLLSARRQLGDRRARG